MAHTAHILSILKPTIPVFLCKGRIIIVAMNRINYAMTSTMMASNWQPGRRLNHHLCNDKVHSFDMWVG